MLALHIDPFLRIFAAFGAEFLGRNVLLAALLLAVELLHLPFDRQAVAIPARHVWRVLAEQGLGAHHRILEHMVQRMADMHVAIGVGRAVVEDEFLAARAGVAHLLVQPRLFPARQDARLLLRQAGFHGKIGLRQEDRVLVIALGAVGFAHRLAPLGHSGRRIKPRVSWLRDGGLLPRPRHRAGPGCGRRCAGTGRGRSPRRPPPIHSRYSSTESLPAVRAG